MRYGSSFSALVVLASCLLPAAVATAQERGVAFANVRFGADPAMVRRAMEGMQLALRARTSAQSFPFDQRFEGELKGSPVLVSALYDAAGQLEKVLVSFLTPDEQCVALYGALKQELRQQYGAPIVDVERWDYPYSNGGHVGQEHFAIRIGRGRLATAWDRTDAGSTQAGVSLMTTDDVIVRLAYESSRWAAESERRQKILSSESEALPGEGTTDDKGGRRMRTAGDASQRRLPPVSPFHSEPRPNAAASHNRITSPTAIAHGPGMRPPRRGPNNRRARMARRTSIAMTAGCLNGVTAHVASLKPTSRASSRHFQ